jgi:hypothetical protein
LILIYWIKRNRTKADAKTPSNEEKKMERKGLKCLALLLVVPLILALNVSCDDDDKLVCCQCTCYTVINPTLGTKEEENRPVEGNGINCETECRYACGETNWELSRHTKIECSEKNKGTDAN